MGAFRTIFEQRLGAGKCVHNFCKRPALYRARLTLRSLIISKPLETLVERMDVCADHRDVVPLNELLDVVWEEVSDGYWQLTRNFPIRNLTRLDFVPLSALPATFKMPGVDPDAAKAS